MSHSSERYEAARILRRLRIAPSDLGYRAQGWFAETLKLLGAEILDIARTGHPDVLAQIRERILRVQVKATNQSEFVLQPNDLEGVRPKFDSEEGYLAVLDLASPLSWHLVPYGFLRGLLGRATPLALLKAMSDERFSLDCTTTFVALVLERQDEISSDTFGVTRRRVLGV